MSELTRRAPAAMAETASRRAVVMTGALAVALLLYALLEHWLAPPLSRHMLHHAIAMNLVAPALSWTLWWWRGSNSILGSLGFIAVATILQIVLLWGWHIPSLFLAAHSSGGLMLAMHLSLFASAILFWLGVISAARSAPFQSVFALLITGKLYCLYGVLLIFAPRELFIGGQHVHHVVAQADQQLAGLIMVSACPVTYLAAAVTIVAKWLNAMDRPVAAPAR